MNTVIELLTWGDFDVQCTDCVLVSQEKLDVGTLKQDFCEMHGISSFKGLPSGDLHSYLISFKQFLMKRGFKELKTTTIYFCD